MVRPLLEAMDTYADGGGLAFWMDTVAQHFGPNGLWEMKGAKDGTPPCMPTRPDLRELPTDRQFAHRMVVASRSDRGISKRFNTNIHSHPIGASIKNTVTRALAVGSPVRFLPWFDITWSRVVLKPGHGDCTHIAYTPFLYEPLVLALHLHLDDALGPM
jgi:hypothetical protein